MSKFWRSVGSFMYRVYVFLAGFIVRQKGYQLANLRGKKAASVGGEADALYDCLLRMVDVVFSSIYE